MAIEYITLYLTDDEQDVSGDDHVSGDLDDNQIVTVLDGGELDDDDEYVFEFWGKNSPTEAGAGDGGDDYFYFDLSGFNDDFEINVKSMDDGDTFKFDNYDSYTVSGTIYTINYTGSDNQPHVVTIDADVTNGSGTIAVALCFARGSGILTANGDVPVEDLSAGDLVRCGDGELRPIKWIGGRRVSSADLAVHPELTPIRIRKSAIDDNCPTQDLVLSPQHRVLLADWKAELLFGEDEVLICAQNLINDFSITPEFGCQGVEYFHILLDSHQTVFANGLECETLMPAEMSQSVLSADAREEIALLFPELVSDISRFGPLYRRALKPFEAQALTSF